MKNEGSNGGSGGFPFAISMGETHQNAIFRRKSSILEYTSQADEMVMGLCLQLNFIHFPSPKQSFIHVTTTSVHLLIFLPFSFRLLLELGKRVSMIQMGDSSATPKTSSTTTI